MKIVRLEQNTEEWLQWRKLGLGSSDAPVIMGVSPFKKSDALFYERTGQQAANEGNWFAQQAMQRGKDYEPEARDWYEGKYGMACIPVCVEHDVHTFLRCSLDGLSIFGTSLTEIKVPGSKCHLEALGGIVPYHYWVQMQYQFLVTGIKEGHYVSYNPDEPDEDRKGIALLVQRDDDFQRALFERIRYFWHCIQTQIMPVEDPWEEAAKAYIVAMQNLRAAENQLQSARDALEQLMPEGTDTLVRSGISATWIPRVEAVDWLVLGKEMLQLNTDEALVKAVLSLKGVVPTKEQLEDATRVTRRRFDVSIGNGYSPAPAEVAPQQPAVQMPEVDQVSLNRRRSIVRW